jgi:PhoPQ-activated pathogenicity-related protein
MGPEYQLRGDVNGFGWTGYMLNMTSQRWLTDDDFSPNSDVKSLWWHYLVVVVPDVLTYTRNASLYITGGSNTNSPPTQYNEDILVAVALATTAGCITGTLFQVPNEHMIFAADPIQKSRSEDAIIAYTWDLFLKDPTKPEWLVRFPMVKASLRAMDAVTEYIAQTKPELGCQLDYYSVAGASKRGWTTWLVGAVDPARVQLIVPIVLDAINFVTVEHHQYRSYGGWSWALHDYTEMNIMANIDDPNMLLLQQQEDPYFFKERLTMPKLVVNAVMDEFQQPDDTRYWWADMPSPKHFIMTPNAEHSEATGILEIVPDISAWLQHHLTQTVVPEFTWSISNTTGEIVATLDNNGLVKEANVWWAYSCGANAFDGVTRRDFRIATVDNPCSCGIYADGTCANLKSFWAKEKLEMEMVKGKRTYRAQMDAPDDGRWVAFLIEVTYEKPKNLKGLPPIPHDLSGRLMFTSEVSVWPNTFPYPECSGATCDAPLV